MNAETSGHRDDPSQAPGNSPRIETGAIRPEDIPGLTPDQLDERIKAAITEFNQSFEEFDPDKVREAFKTQEPQVTSETLINDLGGLEQRVLSSLEAGNGAETPEARNTRLGQFVETHFSDVCPPNARSLAVERCCLFEDGCRELFDEPNLQLGEEDASDPSLREKIAILAEMSAEVATNDETIATRTEERDQKAETVAKQDTQIAINEAEIKQHEAQTPILQDDAQTAETTANNVEADEELIDKEYPKLKADLGSIEAVDKLIGMVKSPEVKARLQKVRGMISALQSAVPGKSEVITRMINQSNLDLTGNSPIQIFAGFLAEADKSNELTDDEKAQIRRIVGQSEKDFQTGSDAQRIARAKEQIIDPKTGEVVGEKYVHDSPDNMAELRPNLGTYMDGERMMLATKDGFISRDVTGWSGEDIGLLAEALELHSFAEEAGITGMVESIGNVHFNVVHDAAFDRAKIVEIRQTMSALVGMGEGYDGDVFDPREKRLLMMAEMRVLTDSDEALEWNNDEAGTAKIIEDMGLKTSGQPNFEVIKAFGAYVQANMNATRATTQAHLYELFPDRVAPPEAFEAA